MKKIEEMNTIVNGWQNYILCKQATRKLVKKYNCKYFFMYKKVLTNKGEKI